MEATTVSELKNRILQLDREEMECLNEANRYRVRIDDADRRRAALMVKRLQYEFLLKTLVSDDDPLPAKAQKAISGAR